MLTNTEWLLNHSDLWNPFILLSSTLIKIESDAMFAFDSYHSLIPELSIDNDLKCMRKYLLF